jgi:hypothetical protein
MKKVTKEKWIRALRSGKFKQGKQRLRADDGGYCCLGVLCEITGNAKNRNMNQSWPRGHRTMFMGLDSQVQLSLAIMNDTNNLNFNQIADAIETLVQAED